MGAELVAPRVTMTTSAPRCAIAASWVSLPWTVRTHEAGHAMGPSRCGKRRWLSYWVPYAPSQRHHHRCDGARHHRPCHSEADLLALLAITFGCSAWALGTSRGSGLSFTSLSSCAFHSDQHSCGQGERCDQDQTTGCYPQSGQRARCCCKRAAQRSSGQHGDHNQNPERAVR